MSTSADPWAQLTSSALGDDDSDEASDFSDTKIAPGTTDNELGDTEPESGSDDNDDDDDPDDGAGPADAIVPAAPAKAAKSAKAAKPAKARPAKAVKSAKAQKRKAPTDSDDAPGSSGGPAPEPEPASESDAQKTPKKRSKGAGAASSAPSAPSVGSIVTAFKSAGGSAKDDSADKTGKAKPKPKSKPKAKAKPVASTVSNADADADAGAGAVGAPPDAGAGAVGAPPETGGTDGADARDVVVIAMDIIDRGYIRHQGSFATCVAKIRSLVGDTKRNMVWVRNFQMYVPRGSPRFERLVGSADDEQRTLCSFSIEDTTRLPPSLDSIFKFAELDPL